MASARGLVCPFVVRLMVTEAAMLPTPQRPCLYCRLSHAPDGSLEKVERQEADGRAMALRLNWPDFCCVFVDNSRSAWQRNRKRPRWDDMLLSLEPRADHSHDGIMVYHGDRLIRQPYDLELLLNIADTRHIPLASVSGVRDLSNPDDRFILRIEAAQACRESDNISRRVKRGVKARVVTGRPRPGGRRPYGWGALTGRTRIKVDPDTGNEYELPVLDYEKTVPEEIAHLKEVGQLLLAGLSKYGAVRWMNQRSTTSMGNPWTVPTLTRALTAWRMAGLIEYEGALYEAVWGEVVSLEMLEDLKALFAKHRDTYGYFGKERKRLLTGIGVCWQCHRPGAGDGVPARCATSVRTCEYQHLTLCVKPVGNRGHASRVYYCRSCGKGRNELLLDAYINGRVLRLLSAPRFVAELNEAEDRQRPDVRKEIVALEHRKAKLYTQIENAADDPDVDPVVLMRAITLYDRKLIQLHTRLEVTSQQRLARRMVGVTRSEWEQEPIDVRASTVAALFHIAMLPTQRGGPGSAPESVMVWRRTLSVERNGQGEGASLPRQVHTSP
ncbi:recombinase family protein [Streptomyces sp. NPDC086554]|uniref:recombinase family protein n=1 Tax=Streptomyces sp. NPDC086554 TaxID=3154864 RepID=UPI0034479784